MSARALTAAFAALLAAATASAQVAQYVITPLDHPPGGNYSSAVGVALNNAGQVAVSLTTPTVGLPPFRAGRYTPAIGTIDLGSFQTGGTSQAEDINAAGQVVGAAQNSVNRAFLYTDGVGMVNLGALPGDSTGEASGINDAGVVVGRSFNATSSRVFRYTSASETCKTWACRPARRVATESPLTTPARSSSRRRPPGG
jgi:probable HAF family extracellular repeat protein